MNDLLQGIRVVESAVLLVGDHLGMLLGDQGAEIIKMEQPGSGDYVRKIMGQFAPDVSPMHVMVNRNKRSLTLDPRGAGREVFEALIRDADVYITGQVAGVPEKLGTDYASVRAINPGIVYCQCTGYGADGPYSTLPTHGQMMESLGGSPALAMGDDGRIQQTRAGVPGSGTIIGTLFGAYAIAAALVKRSRTGEGCYLDISCSDAVVAAGWPAGVALLNPDKLQAAEDVATFPADGWRSSAKYTYYRTRDHRFVLFCPIEKKFWDAFCNAAGRPDLCERHSTVTRVDYGENDFALMADLQALFDSRDLREWTDLFVRHGIPGGPALPIEQAPEDPHLAARGIVVEEEHPQVGHLRVIGTPVRVNGAPFRVRRHAPTLGQHTDEVLTELGYDAGRIAELRATRAV